MKEIKNDCLYYIGIGASAGGLEALQEFFKAMPNDTGMVFVVIQHLSPDYKSMMNELLARYTEMKIEKIADNMEAKANTIYLIPPAHNVTIFNGKFYLQMQNTKRGINLPVDIFFRSLANDKEKNAVGIILSGTGSDGTLGIRAIKEMGGMVMAQDEHSAKFDGMPRSAVSTGLVDYILPPGKIAEALLNYIKHPLIAKTKAEEQIVSPSMNTMTKIILLLRDFCGVDFSHYKENTIVRRIERRVSINRFNTLEEYLTFITYSDQEKETLYKELLIGVTRFFRDYEAFASIKEKVLPKILKGKKAVRIWSAGCSTGEEVYSLAILCAEYIFEHKLNCQVKIFATDIDKHALQVASHGLYPDNIAADVEPVLLAKYFTPRDNLYQINEEIRKLVVFAAHNLLKDPPFSKLDLIVCRNLFIYFKPDVQQKLFSMFYYSLNSGGFLFMGSSESIGDMGESFIISDSKWKIYQYNEHFKPDYVKDIPVLRYHQVDSGSMGTSVYSALHGKKFERILESAISTLTPPSVIVDEQDNIIHIINDMNPFLKIKSGRFSNNLITNLPIEISMFVSNILRRLKTGGQEITFENIAGVTGFKEQPFSIEGRTIQSDYGSYYLISFRIGNKKIDETIEPGLSVDIEKEVTSRVKELEKELQSTKESLQATVEELETSNEELQSSNEELVASNEELQSTNEELQAVNEELYSVNSELQMRIEELVSLNNDLDNLIKNAEVGALYLDNNLCIRKITPLISKITNILTSDIGRPITHISVINEYRDMLKDINTVVETLQSIDKEYVDRKGNIWLARIRPYRTEHNAVDGTMVTFFNINKIKAQERKMDKELYKFELAMKIGQMAWWEWSIRQDKMEYDHNFARMTGYSMEGLPNNIINFAQLIHPDDYESFMEIILGIQDGVKTEFSLYFRILKSSQEYAWCYGYGIVSSEYSWTSAGLLVGYFALVTKDREKDFLLNQKGINNTDFKI